MKDTTIQIRVSEEYKKVLQEDAAALDMSLSQYVRFAMICKLNLEKCCPDIYNDLVDMTNYLPV